MLEFKSLTELDVANQEQLEQWLTQVQAIYHANEKEHFATILTDLNSLSQLAPNFVINQTETIKQLTTQIEFVLKTIAEQENPQQLAKNEKVRRESIVPQIEAQKEREEQLRTRLHSRSPSVILSPSVNSSKNSQLSMDKTTPEINNYLNQVITEWKEIIKTNDPSQQTNIPFMPELTTLIENALAINNKKAYQELLKTWTTNYLDWNDKARWDRKKLELLIKSYESSKTSSNHSEEVEELKLEITDLKRKLLEAQKRAEVKNQEWRQANARIDTEVTKSVRSTTAKFKSFVNPNDEKALEKVAKDKLNMVTQIELAEEVSKSLLPLRVWENTFPEQSAQVVKDKQEELIIELTPWQETFENQTAEQVQAEITTITAEKKQARLERKAMELEKDNYKEDVDRMEGEVTNYYQEYQRFLNLSSKKQERIDQLEEQIYSFGQTPVEEPDSDNEGDNQSLIDDNEAELSNQEKSATSSVPNSPHLTNHSNNSQTSLKSDVEELENQIETNSQEEFAESKVEQSVLDKIDIVKETGQRLFDQADHRQQIFNDYQQKQQEIKILFQDSNLSKEQKLDKVAEKNKELIELLTIITDNYNPQEFGNENTDLTSLDEAGQQAWKSLQADKATILKLEADMEKIKGEITEANRVAKEQHLAQLAEGKADLIIKIFDNQILVEQKLTTVAQIEINN